MSVLKKFQSFGSDFVVENRNKVLAYLRSYPDLVGPLETAVRELQGAFPGYPITLSLYDDLEIRSSYLLLKVHKSSIRGLDEYDFRALYRVEDVVLPELRGKSGWIEMVLV